MPSHAHRPCQARHHSNTGTYTYNGSEHTAAVRAILPRWDISGNTEQIARDYTVSVTSRTGRWADGKARATAVWSISKAPRRKRPTAWPVSPRTTEVEATGRITGVDTMMEYRMAGRQLYTCGGHGDWQPVCRQLLCPARRTTTISPDGEVTVGDGTPLADCAITQCRRRKWKHGIQDRR